MLNVLLFYGLTLASSAYALWRGGAPERWIAASLLAATLVSTAVYRAYASFEYGLAAVDLVLLVALIGIALRANRLWPMAIAAMHLATMLAHGVELVASGTPAWTYQFLLKIWSYPMMLVLVIGAVRHRQRLRRQGVDQPWS